MKPLSNRRKWLRRMAVPLLILLLASIGWAGSTNLILYRSLGVTTSWADGRPMSLGEELLMRAAFGGQFVVLMLLLLAAGMCLSVRHFRWSVVLGSIIVIGTPIALVYGQYLAHYLWRLNRAGTPWEEVVPVAGGFLVGCAVGLLADAGIDRLQEIDRRPGERDRGAAGSVRSEESNQEKTR